MGGSGVAYWAPIAETYGLDLHVVNPYVDPTFGFMTLDHDGKIRMDCSSPYAMASLVKLKDQFDIAFGNDSDYDRHGIVTRSVGLMNPNHFLSVAIWYLFQNRPGWGEEVGIGKTLVSSSMIDRVAAHLNASCARCRSVSSGSWMACWTAHSVSAGKRAPAHPSCARMEHLDHRQGWLHPGPAGGRDPGGDRPRPGRALPGAGGAVWKGLVRAQRRARHPSRENRSGQPVS
jgi:hypothetical protein